MEAHEKGAIRSGVKSPRVYPLPDLPSLKTRLSYNPQTGNLVWNDPPSNRAPRYWEWRYRGKNAGTIKKNGYIEVLYDRKTLQAHRIAWALSYGYWPTGEIDHINGVRTDNRIENLREVSRSMNQRNRCMVKTNTSGHWGIRMRGNRYAVSVGTGKGKYLGQYNDLEIALLVRDEKADKLGYHSNHGRTPSRAINKDNGDKDE